MNDKKSISSLRQLLDNGKKLVNLPYYNQDYSQWLEQAKTTLEMLFQRNSRQLINFDRHVISYTYLRSLTTEEKQGIYDEKLGANLAYMQNLISGLEQATKIQQTFLPEIAYQNFYQGLRRFWKDTIKAAVEGIVNGLKKP
jgi:hypothetical protein